MVVVFFFTLQLAKTKPRSSDLITYGSRETDDTWPQAVPGARVEGDRRKETQSRCDATDSARSFPRFCRQPRTCTRKHRIPPSICPSHPPPPSLPCVVCGRKVCVVCWCVVCWCVGVCVFLEEVHHVHLLVGGELVVGLEERLLGAHHRRRGPLYVCLCVCVSVCKCVCKCVF